MYKIPFSQLQRTIAAGGELPTRSEAREAEMALTIAEEAALEEWCLVMYRWGSPVRLDIFGGMAVAILDDRERRNIESAPDFFKRIMDPEFRSFCTRLTQRGISKHLIFPALDALGIKDFFLSILNSNQRTALHWIMTV